MRKYFCVAAAAALMLAIICTQVSAGEKKGAKKMNTGKKVLVVYYSHSGNTRALAEQLHALAGGDIFELQPVDAYPVEYGAVVAQAKKEIQAGFKPRLKAQPKDMKFYDMIIVGTPNWWSTLAGPVTTFLSENDLSGKTVAPFLTHGGGGAGHIPADVKKLCPKSNVTEALVVSASEAADSRGEVAAWLRKLGLVK